MIQTILPRPDHFAPTSFTSASARPYVGRAVLVNAHLEGVDCARLASALIHEAMHSFLYRVEREATLTNPYQFGLRTLIESPWSGNRLRLTTYLHACFIYFGLANFWRLPSTVSVFGKHAVAQSRCFVERGFSRGEFFARLQSYRAHISRELFYALAAIAREPW
jgi:HEXXH motif-containing protein